MMYNVGQQQQNYLMNQTNMNNVPPQMSQQNNQQPQQNLVNKMDNQNNNNNNMQYFNSVNSQNPMNTPMMFPNQNQQCNQNMPMGQQGFFPGQMYPQQFNQQQGYYYYPYNQYQQQQQMMNNGNNNNQNQNQIPLFFPNQQQQFYQFQLQQQQQQQQQNFQMNNQCQQMMYNPMLDSGMMQPSQQQQQLFQQQQFQMQMQQKQNQNNNEIQGNLQNMSLQKQKQESDTDQDNENNEINSQFSQSLSKNSNYFVCKKEDSKLDQEEQNIHNSTASTNISTSFSDKENNIDCRCPLPDLQNQWVQKSLQKPFTRSLFPQNYTEQDCKSLFDLREGESPIQVKLSLPTKEEFLVKAEKLHKKKRSKFHNKNKVFFISILKLFKKQQMEKLNIPEKLYKNLMELVMACRVSGRKIVNDKIQKTDLFNHSHYNLLFLTLNPDTIQQMGENEKDRQVHLKTFGIDLKKQEIVQYRENEGEKKLALTTKEKHQFNLYGSDKLVLEEKMKDKMNFWAFIGQINFLKTCLYQILVLHLKDQMLGTAQQQSEEREYDYRAFLGILEMVKGNNIDKF